MTYPTFTDLDHLRLTISQARNWAMREKEERPVGATDPYTRLVWRALRGRLTVAQYALLKPKIELLYDQR